MTIDTDIFKQQWVRQGTQPNCGSCCVASIVNYAREKRGGITGSGTPARMNNGRHIGLAVDGVCSLGSVSSKICSWIEGEYPNGLRVTQVKVANRRAHWGGLVNKATDGASHREVVTPDRAYFDGHPDRFLLREFSAMVVAGHFIIQTGVDDFWDPNLRAGELPMNLDGIRRHHVALSERADALQIDVKP